MLAEEGDFRNEFLGFLLVETAVLKQIEELQEPLQKIVDNLENVDGGEEANEVHVRVEEDLDSFGKRF